MKKSYLLVILIFCLTFWSCSHNQLVDFNSIVSGDDKEAVLTKAGSPVRSKFRQGQDIWTYRFVVDSGYEYKDVIFENQKVIEIRNSQDINLKMLEKKEKQVEEDLKIKKNESKPVVKPKLKPKIDDSILNEKSMPNNKFKKNTFVPVEE